MLKHEIIIVYDVNSSYILLFYFNNTASVLLSKKSITEKENINTYQWILELKNVLMLLVSSCEDDN